MAEAVTVLINTKDRADVLGRALDSVIMQSVPAEIVVIDDGSRDGTSHLVENRYPLARLVRNEEPRGIIQARNQGFAVANGDIVIILDDDAEFTNAETIEAVLRLFDDPRVGAVALPIVDIVAGVAIKYEARRPESSEVLCAASFFGGGAAIRGADFHALGGFNGIDRQGEEGDFSLRLLNRGKVVRVAPTELAINHYPKHKAAASGAHLQASVRNRLLSVRTTTPSGFVAAESAAVMLNYTLYGMRTGLVPFVIEGVREAARAYRQSGKPRQPVSRGSHRLHRHLVRRGSLPLSEIVDRLQPWDAGVDSE